MFWMITMLILTSLYFLLMSHPLSMLLSIITFSLLTGLITGNFMENMWYSYMLFIMMIGGMLVIFIYMTSIASNEMIIMNLKPMMIMIFLIPMVSILTIYLQNNYKMTPLINSNPTSMTKYTNYPMSLILILMFSYLLITLIASVKITKTENSPLRQKF